MSKIVVGVDGSERQERVVERAVQQGGYTQMELILVRAIGLPAEVPATAFAVEPDNLSRMLEDVAQKELDQLVARVKGRVSSCRGVVQLGTPWRAICDVADAEKADLIVIGSHGYGVVDRILGTTAAKVVNHAHCSVLVVR